MSINWSDTCIKGAPYRAMLASFESYFSHLSYILVIESYIGHLSHILVIYSLYDMSAHYSSTGVEGQHASLKNDYMCMLLVIY